MACAECAMKKPTASVEEAVQEQAIMCAQFQMSTDLNAKKMDSSHILWTLLWPQKIMRSIESRNRKINKELWDSFEERTWQWENVSVWILRIHGKKQKEWGIYLIHKTFLVISKRKCNYSLFPIEKYPEKNEILQAYILFHCT